MRPPLIGVSGYAGAGKDEAARGLVPYGYERGSFADILRQFLYALDPAVDTATNKGYDWLKPPYGFRYVPLRQIIDSEGWEVAKRKYPHLRQLQQRCGTDAGRNVLYQDVWVDAAIRKVTGPTVFADVRFPNEANAIKAKGGVVIRITRPGVGPVNDHISETALNDYKFDAQVDNDGNIDDLHDFVIDAAFGPEHS